MEQWIHQIQDKSLYFEKFQPYVDYKEVQAFLDFCIKLMSENKDNASIILYGLKVFQGHTLTHNAQVYLSKVIMSLSLIYPYIVPLLDEFLFESYTIDLMLIEKCLNQIYIRYLSKNYYEACSYALYYATKYDIQIATFNVNEIIAKKDGILLLLALIYCRKHSKTADLRLLKNYAKQLKANNLLEEYWPFVYECLTVGLLAKKKKKMKQANVSFLKPEYR